MAIRSVRYWALKLLSLCGIFLTVGFLPHAIPGSPLALYESWPSPAQQRAVLIHEYGLDRSVPVQYAIWLRRTITGHWGHSRFYQRAVFPEILRATGFTLALLFWVVVVCLSGMMGLWALQHIMPTPRRTCSQTTLLAIAAVFPSFLVVIVLHDVAIWQFGWLRLVTPLQFQPSYLLNPIAMLLPASILAVPPLLVWYSCSRGTSAHMAGTLDEPRQTRWNGFCLLFHPLLASFLLEVLLVEHVMGLPGLGRLGIEALKRRDFPLLQGFMLWGGLLYLVLGIVFELRLGRATHTSVLTPHHRVRPTSHSSTHLGLYGGMWGLLLLLALAAWAVQLLPYDPTEIHRYDQLRGPSSRYVLGTDFLGRDVLSRTLQGFRSAIPRIFLLTMLTGSVAWGVHWLASRCPGPLRLVGKSLVALCNALPPFLFAFMVFLVVEHRPRPLEITLALASLPIAAQLMSSPRSLWHQGAQLSRLAAYLLFLELTFLFLNLSPESLTPTWGSDIRLGMHYNHINVWLVIAPSLAFAWSRYIFHSLGLYASLTTTDDV